MRWVLVLAIAIPFEPGATVALAQQQSAATVRAPAVLNVGSLRLDVHGETPGLILVRFVSHHGYENLCVAPCELRLRAGEYTFTVEEDGDRVRRADPIAIDRSGRIEVGITRRRKVRLALAFLGAAIMGGGTVIGATSFTRGECAGCVRPELILPALPVLAAGFALIMVSVFDRDRARIVFLPD